MLRKIGGAILLWVCVFCGGVIPMLANAIQPYFARYREGDLGFLILQIVSSAIGAVIGVAICRAITKGEFEIGIMVNCIIAATVLAVLLLMSILLNSYSVARIISFVLEIVALIICAVNAYGKSSEKVKESQ